MVLTLTDHTTNDPDTYELGAANRAQSFLEIRNDFTAFNLQVFFVRQTCNGLALLVLASGEAKQRMSKSITSS